MRRRILFSLLAGCAASLAALVVFSSLKQSSSAARAETVKSINILVAARDLPSGATLASDSFKAVPWSADSIPPGAITQPTQLLNRSTRVALLQNEPLTRDRLDRGDSNHDKTTVIPARMRAVAAPVDAISDVSGIVRPGARVDVLVSVGAGNSPPFSRIILQDVEVMAIAQADNANGARSDGARLVTMLVGPDDAERLTLASREGTLSLAVRNPSDSQIVRTSGIDVADLFRGSSGVSSARTDGPLRHGPPSATTTVEVMRNGRSVERVAFDHDRQVGDTIASGAPSTPQSAAPKPLTTAQRDAGAVDLAAAASVVRALRDVKQGAEPSSAAYQSPNARTVDLP